MGNGRLQSPARADHGRVQPGHLPRNEDPLFAKCKAELARWPTSYSLIWHGNAAGIAHPLFALSLVTL